MACRVLTEPTIPYSVPDERIACVGQTEAGSSVRPFLGLHHGNILSKQSSSATWTKCPDINLLLLFTDQDNISCTKSCQTENPSLVCWSMNIDSGCLANINRLTTLGPLLSLERTPILALVDNF